MSLILQKKGSNGISNFQTLLHITNGGNPQASLVTQGLAWHAAALASFAPCARCGPDGRRAGAAAAAVFLVLGGAMPTAAVAPAATWRRRVERC